MFEVLKDSFRTAVKNPITYAAIVAIPLIVALFGLFYAGTFHAPYDKTDQIPAAIINLDMGTTVDGEDKNYGADIAEAILDAKALDWHQETKATYDAGLESSPYFMALIIPEDFSKQISAAKTTEPEVAGITFWKNSRKNFMVSTMANVVEAKLNDTINKKITEIYAKALAEGLESAKDGMTEAAEGADKLSDGASKLKDGLTTAQNGSSKLQNGISELNQGMKDLKNGSSSIKDGISNLNSGAKTYKNTLSGQIDSSADSKVSAAQQALSSALTNHSQVAAGKTAAFTAQTMATTGNPPTSQQVAAFLASDGDVAASAAAVSQAAETLANAAGNKGKSAALAQAVQGFSAIDGGIDQLATNYEKFNSGVSASTAGAQKLQSGSSSLTEGLKDAKSGANSLNSGSNELSSALNDGAQSIDDSLTANPEQYGEYIAQPVEIETDDFGALNSFGFGFIPLFMSICFWIGALMIYFVFEPFPSYRHLRAGRFSAIFGRLPIYMCMMALEIVTVLALALMVLNLQYTDLLTLIALVCAIGFSFMCILLLLNLFDRIGKATAVILVILQIVCCWGTFPAFLGTDFASAIAPYLPFFYSVDGYREIISGGNLAQVHFDIMMLLAYGVGSLILAVLAYPLGLKIKLRQDKQKAMEYMEWQDANGKHSA